MEINLSAVTREPLKLYRHKRHCKKRFWWRTFEVWWRICDVRSFKIFRPKILIEKLQKLLRFTSSKMF